MNVLSSQNAGYGCLEDNAAASEDRLGQSAGNDTRRWSAHIALLLTILITLCGMCTWFSTGAILSQLCDVYGITTREGDLLTIVVNVGFLIGALTSVGLRLADRVRPTRLIGIGSAVAAGLNCCLLIPGLGLGWALLFRGLTGMAMALVYPQACKVTATWYVENRGAAMGLVVGSVGVGSSFPHLVNAVSSVEWRTLLVTCSVVSAGGSMLAFTLLHEGPHWVRWKERNGEELDCCMDDAYKPLPDAEDSGMDDQGGTTGGVRDKREESGGGGGDGGTVLRGCEERPPFGVVLQSSAFWYTVIGYCGHNWELYALWFKFKDFAGDKRIGSDVFGSESRGDSLAAFFVISSAFVGSTVAGLVADRIGRTTVCLVSLTVSVVCSLTIGWVESPLLVLLAGVMWGAFAVSESAQYSAMVAELVDPAWVGSAVTLQFAVGYFFTIPPMYIVPAIEEGSGNWGAVWSSLAPGTLLAAVAILLLRGHPAAQRAKGSRQCF